MDLLGIFLTKISSAAAMRQAMKMATSTGLIWEKEKLLCSSTGKAPKATSRMAIRMRMMEHLPSKIIG